MSNDFISRWSGPAAAVGGILWLLPWTRWINFDDTFGFLVAIVGLILVALGLLGLQRRLPHEEGARNGLFFAVAIIGVLAVLVSALGGILTGAALTGGASYLAILLGGGILLILIGLAGMGMSILSAKALGRFSFMPLLLAAALLGYMLAIGLTVYNPALRSIYNISLIFVMICWLLLGVALWTTQEENLAAV